MRGWTTRGAIKVAVQPFLCSDSSDTAATQQAQGEKTYCLGRHDNTKTKHIADASIIATRWQNLEKQEE